MREVGRRWGEGLWGLRAGECIYRKCPHAGPAQVEYRTRRREGQSSSWIQVWQLFILCQGVLAVCTLATNNCLLHYNVSLIYYAFTLIITIIYILNVVHLFIQSIIIYLIIDLTVFNNPSSIIRLYLSIQNQNYNQNMCMVIKVQHCIR